MAEEASWPVQGCVGAGAQAALETQLWFPRHPLDFQERRHLLPRSAQPAPIGCTWVGHAKAATSVFAHVFLHDPCLGFDKYPQTRVMEVSHQASANGAGNTEKHDVQKELILWGLTGSPVFRNIAIKCS